MIAVLAATLSKGGVALVVLSIVELLKLETYTTMRQNNTYFINQQSFL